MLKEQAALRRTNRRLTSRHVCHVQVDFRIGGEWRRATAMDVSNNGCRLRLGEELPRGAQVTVCFRYTGADAQPLQAEAKGTVIWSRVEGLSHQSGIHFSQECPDVSAIIAALG